MRHGPNTGLRFPSLKRLFWIRTISRLYCTPPRELLSSHTADRYCSVLLASAFNRFCHKAVLHCLRPMQIPCKNDSLASQKMNQEEPNSMHLTGHRSQDDCQRDRETQFWMIARCNWFQFFVLWRGLWELWTLTTVHNVVFFRFKRLTGRHDAQIYESDYKYFAARVKNRRTPQHNLSTITVLQVPTYVRLSALGYEIGAFTW